MDKLKKAALFVPAVAVTAMPVFASSVGGTYDTVSSSMVTAVTSMANAGLAAIGDIVPVAAPVLGAMVIIGIGIRAFKRFTGR